MSDKKTPKEELIEQIEDIVLVFEKKTGCRVLNIERVFLQDLASTYHRLETKLELK